MRKPTKQLNRGLSRALSRSTWRGFAGSDSAPTYEFFITPSTETPVAGVEVDFSCNPNPAKTVASYSWSMGDGTVPYTIADPSHYFVGLGPYTVSVTVTYTDDSTDTDTQLISPTAPSATSGQTLVQSELFSADRSSGSLGGFGEWFGSANIISGPNGAKLAATAGVGYSGRSVGNSWHGGWDIDNPLADGTFFQVGAWFFFDRFDQINTARRGMLAGLRTNDGAGLQQGLSVNGLGVLSITAWDFEVLSGRPETVIGTIQTGKWYWLGLAIGGNGGGGWLNAKTIVKELGQPESIVTTKINNGNTSGYMGVGVLGNFDHSCKISYATLHTLTSLSAAHYPGNEVQPQLANYIYNVNPSTGSDSNDGVTGPWQGITKVNSMLDPTSYGIDSVGVDGEVGSGAWLKIDTSAAPFDVGISRLRVYRPSLRIKSATTSKAFIKAYRTIAAGEWSVTGGYTGIYQITMDASHSKVGVWSNDVWHEQLASLAALNLASAGASYNNGATLYLKPFGSTDPRTDGKTYIHSIPNTADGGVGFRAVTVAAKDCLVEQLDIGYLASTGNGQYAIGDWTGFSGKLLVRNCKTYFGDKHLICYTINATNSEIITEDCEVEQSLGQSLTSYMGSGSGNDHIYRRITMKKSGLQPRSAAGTDTQPGAFYAHGGYGVFDSITFEDCNFYSNDIGTEGIILTMIYDGVTASYLQEDCPIDATGLVLSDLPRLRQGGIVTDSSITPVAGGFLARELDGTLAITNTVFDMRGASSQFSDGGMFKPSTFVGNLNLTFTGNTVRFGTVYPNADTPIFKDMSTADIVACNNNTYYIPAGAIFAKNFNDGTTTADRTFAQWQALGYDTSSTRLDPT
jgi:hypothetical protein